MASSNQQAELDGVTGGPDGEQAVESALAHGSAEGHNQRTTTACLQCRSRKRRCGGEKPACSNCLSVQAACQYPSLLKRRGPGRSKQRVTVLEERLLQLEAKLQGRRSSVAQQDHTSHGEPADTTRPSDSLRNTPEPSKAVQTGAGVFQTAQTPNPLRGLSLPIHLLFKHAPDQVTEPSASDYSAPFRSMIVSPVLPRVAELSLLAHSIDDICNEFPFKLCGIREFLGRVKSQKDASVNYESYDSASQWACVNVAIALAIHGRRTNRSFQKLSSFVWSYFKNAYAASPELVLHGHDLDTIQALVLMALFCRDSADVKTTSLLLSTAIRLSQSLELVFSRAGHGGNHNGAESEDARRTIWTAFIMDAELSLCSGLTPALGAGEIEMDLPGEEHSHDGDELSRAKVFKWRAELALIHVEVRKRLYSRDALDMSRSELLSTIFTLDQTLEDWRRKLPPELQPGSNAATLEPQFAILRLAFHNLTSMVYWTARRHSSSSESRVGEQNLSVASISLGRARAAAQHTLRVLQQSPFEQFAQFWRNLCYPLAAAMTLLLCILECPEDPLAAADAQLLNSFGRQARQMQDQGDFETLNLLRACLGLEQLANAAISQAQAAEAMEEVGAESSLQDTFPHDALQTARDLLSSATHPMYLAQGLLTNLPNRDIKICRSVARVLRIPIPESTAPSYGPLVPECVKPGTYGFGFEGRAQ